MDISKNSLGVGNRVLYQHAHNYFIPAIVEEKFDNIYGISYLYRGEWTYINCVIGDSVGEIKS